MANTKKRKDTPQAATLHDFFGKPGNASAKKKPKLQTQNKPKTTPVKREPFSVAPDEIIVIESDDEIVVQSGVEFVDVSSDVEVVEPLQTQKAKGKKREVAKASPSRSPAGREQENVAPIEPSPVDGTLFGSPTLLRPHSTPATDNSTDDSFGIPTLLLGAQSPSHKHSSIPTEQSETSYEQKLMPPPELPRKMLDENIPDVGSSSSMNNRGTSLTDAIPKECSVPPTPMLQEGTSVPAGSSLLTEDETGDSHFDIDDSRQVEDIIEIDDEWETGDDEIIMEDVDPSILSKRRAPQRRQSEADIDLTLDSDPPDESVQSESCPICGCPTAGMSATEIQRHVNDCIDSGPPQRAAHTHVDIPIAGLSKPPPIPATESSETIDTTMDVDEDMHDVQPGSDAFSVIMTSHKENEAWKEASVAEDRNFRPTKGNGGRRKAPFYKVMTGMPIAVDAFRYGTIPGVTAYFLTHAHSDHYTNLGSNWKSGPIYCSEATANLIKHMLRVDPKWVHPLPMDTPVTIPNTGGVQVTLIEANHCPGSCLFLFEGFQTVDAGDSTYKSKFVGTKRIFRYLHCGDFRASPAHVLHPAVEGKPIDCVYLDTTYLDPRYCFPPQPQVISACAELAKRIVSGSPLNENADGKTRPVTGWFTRKTEPKEQSNGAAKGKTLVVVGTYSIGKERIVKAIAKELQTKIYCDARKAAILRCESDPELHAMLTNDPFAAGVHLVPLGVIASDKLKVYMERWKGRFSKIVGFRPTGWTYSQPSGSDPLPSISAVISRSQQRTFTYSNLTPMKNSTTNLQVYGVPYSEHSSFFELTCFALSFDWVRMIATVNVGSESSRGKMAKWVEKWEAERKRRGKIEVVSHRAPDYW